MHAFIFDLSAEPLSFGDFLVFCLVANLKVEALPKDSEVLVFLIGDENSLGVSEVFKGQDKAEFFRKRVLNLGSMVELIGCRTRLLFLKSRNELGSIISEIKTPLRLEWPPKKNFIDRTYSFYSCLDFIISIDPQKLKRPSFPEVLLNCAHFLLSELRSKWDCIVTVNLRADKDVSKLRNSNFETWNNFFKSQLGNKVLFLYLASRDQIEASVVQNHNVIWSGSFKEDPLFDLALMELADLHLGASSGLTAYFLFRPDKTCHVFKSDVFSFRSEYSGRLDYYSDELAHFTHRSNFNFHKSETIQLLSQSISSAINFKGSVSVTDPP